MELKNTFVSALLVALLSLTSALSHAAHQDSLAPGNWPTFNGEVHDVLILPDSSFIVGGGFQSVTINGTTTSRSRLVHINANLTLDTNFPTASSTVNCLATDAAGRIYIGGDFTSLTVGAVTTDRTRVARLTASFGVDSAFNTSAAGPLGAVLALAPAGDGSVYIGGRFNGVGSVVSPGSYAAYRLAKLKADGSLDAGFKSGANNDVNTILRLPNGTLYVGGISNWWGLKPGVPPLKPNTPIYRLAKLSASGGLDAGFKAPDINNFTCIVNDVIQLADGSLLVGCNSGVKHVNAATGAAIAYSLTGHSIEVKSVAKQADGKLLSGAYGTCFLTDIQGVKDPNFDLSTRITAGYINTIKLDRNGRIFIGGDFTFNDGVNTRSKLVVLNGTDPRSQSITFPAVANPKFLPPNNVFTLGATSSSALPVTYAVTSGNATLAGNKLTILGAGTIVVTATQAGNATFDPATPNALNIFVPLEAQTISFAPLIDRPTGNAPFLLSASSTSGLTVTYDVIDGPADVDGNQLTLTGQPGIVTIRAEQDGNVDYLAAAPVEQSFEVFTGFAAPLAQTIVFNPLPARFANESAFGISAVSTSGLPVTLAVTSGGNIASIAGNTVTLSGQTGDVTITATQAGNINFLAAKSVAQKFKVNAAATALTLTDLLQTYDGTPKDIGVVGAAGPVTISYTINKIKGTTPPTAAGSYAVEAVAGAVKKTGTLIISKAPLIVAAADQRKFVGQANPALTFAFSGFIGNDHAGNSFTKAVTVSTKATATSPGGSYPITPAGGLANNYALVYVNGNLQVESWAGQYEALIETPGGDLPVGKLEITVLANSIGFTGKLTTAKGAAASFKGDLTRNLGTEVATATVNGVVGTGATAVTYGFDLGLPLMDDFTAAVTRKVGAGAAAPFGDTTIGQKIHLPTGTPPVSYAGAHTLIMESPTHLTASVLPLPKGSSHATVAIDAKGKMILAGVLADGTKITASLFPDYVRGYRLYALPYGTRLDSYAAAWLYLVPHPDLPGRGFIPVQTQAFYWAKAASTKDLNYRDGFPETSGGLILDPWQAPATKPTVINLRQRLVLNASGEMDVFHSDLPGTLNTTGLPALVTMDAAGKVIVPTSDPNNPRAWKVAITSTTGGFVGSHTVLDGTKPLTVNFSGVMRQPPSTEVGAHVIGVGFEIVPQLNGQTAGTTSNEISFERTAQPDN